MNGRAWGGLLLGNRQVLLLIANAVPIVRLWPFERPISRFPSLGLVAVDGLTPFALPADLLSGAPERRQRAPRGEPLDPGERPKDSGLWFVIPTRRPVCLELCGPPSSLLDGFWCVP